MTGRPALILHGGAGARRERDYTREIAHMGEVVAAMKARLDAGAQLKKNEVVELAFKTVHLFDRESGRSLRDEP